MLVAQAELDQADALCVEALRLSTVAIPPLGLGMRASFTPERPKPNMVAYVAEDGQAHWVTVAGPEATAASLLDEWTGQFLPAGAEASTFNPWGAYFVDVANPAYPAIAAHSTRPAPQLTILSETVIQAGSRTIQARLELDTPVHMLILRVDVSGAGPTDGLTGLQMLDEKLDQVAAPDRPAQRVWLEFYGVDTDIMDLELTIAGSGDVGLWVEERRFGLPDMADGPIRPRPDWMMPSPTFISDSSLIRTSFVLP